MLVTKINHKRCAGLTALLFLILLSSCRKLIEIDPPTNSQSEAATYSSVDGATAAVYAMYDKMKLLIANRLRGYEVVRLNAIYSDEYVVTSTSTILLEVYQHAVAPNTFATRSIWNDSYHMIYTSNAIIEGIEKYGKTISDTLRKQFTGEAKFVRAWGHWLLANVYGDVPIVLTTDYNVNRLAARSPQPAVYQQIVNDLLSAKELLRDYYLNQGNTRAAANERVRANKDVATAFLARVYGYMGEWQKAEAMASEVITKPGSYSLNSNLAAVFDNSSPENILQVFEPGFHANDQYDLTSTDPTTTTSTNKSGYLSDSVVNKFEPGDKRKTTWIGIRTSGVNTWNFPKKYKARPTPVPANNTVQDWASAMRLAELYLVRAEARIQQNKISDGISDLNVLRTRSRAAATTAVPNPLPALLLSLSKTDAMLALEKEWTREMFMEGHRWFNLKRWKGINNPSISRADELMPKIATAKGGSWQPHKKLFPLPFNELINNPNLVQNEGY